MSLPNARTISVGKRTFQWLCRRATKNEMDNLPQYPRILTIQELKKGGKTVQHRLDTVRVTPEFVSYTIEDDILTGKFT